MTSPSREEQKLHAQAAEVRERLDGLAADLRVVDDELEGLATQRAHHDLLAQACGSLEQLDQLGVATLFWGEKIAPARAEETLRAVRDRVTVFQAQLDELDGRRREIAEKMGLQERNLELLGEDLYDLRQEEERRKQEWIVERDIGPEPQRVQRMAWARGGDDDRRFRKALGVAMLASFLLGVAIPMIDLPLPERFVPEDMPKRLAQLVRKAQAKPATPPPVADTPSEKDRPEPEEQDRPEPEEQPEPDPEAPVVADASPSEKPGPPGPEGPGTSPVPPRKQVGKAGILAFRDKFASLAKDDVAPRLGSDARYGDADDVTRDSTRSMLTSNAPGSSRGIDLASLSRNTGGNGSGGGGGGGGGGGIQGVQVGRASSAIAAIGGGGGGGGRPLAGDGPGASRTDEEIQIVFDRYKASFYRLYNRELRNDPTLRGQMVLQLTIEPDGSVSMCVLQSTDMDAPVLADQVVERVKTINFGAKDVEALTIVYPIDFLPAA